MGRGLGRFVTQPPLGFFGGLKGCLERLPFNDRLVKLCLESGDLALERREPLDLAPKVGHHDLGLGLATGRALAPPEPVDQPFGQPSDEDTGHEPPEKRSHACTLGDVAFTQSWRRTAEKAGYKARVEWAVIAIYGLLALVAWTNAFFMTRPREIGSPAGFVALIPARNEAGKIGGLVATLCSQGVPVIVYDDGSTDGTAEEAARAGAQVARGPATLPEGWTGKNHACDQLAKLAAETSSLEWMVFLDADVVPGPGFAEGLGSLISTVGFRCPVITGFGRLLPGRGLEPVYLFWVPFLLLATNPFGLVSRARLGHNRFLNGQIVAWRSSEYFRWLPHQAVKSRILEDVLIGRLLARNGVRVEVADLSRVMSVRMYRTMGEALDGMSKNSHEITGSVAGTVLLGFFMVLLAVGWWFGWPASAALLLLACLGVRTVVRTPLWVLPLAPLSCFFGALTMARSLVWRKRGVRWKDRTYSPEG